MTQDQLLLLAAALSAVFVALAAAWFVYGVWYTQNRSPGRAKWRWIVYNRTRRRWHKHKTSKLNPPVTLQVDDMTLNMALDYDARARRRRKHGQSNT